eukprot:CAMPEP_0117659212 /NCGR_PEP_ID=MMETSP0804-20121206/6304_1 /TAXON_ID=1074897 /ORGANISM="Tetraselmis astigmatica, Strain CCMP880" /LENGTH=106 /DNA_ID=CAMNT_0005465839 /DNA_START=239 /DNA_END=560 /DNA_ORIENTATION=+
MSAEAWRGNVLTFQRAQQQEPAPPGFPFLLNFLLLLSQRCNPAFQVLDAVLQVICGVRHMADDCLNNFLRTQVNPFAGYDYIACCLQGFENITRTLLAQCSAALQT